MTSSSEGVAEELAGIQCEINALLRRRPGKPWRLETVLAAMSAGFVRPEDAYHLLAGAGATSAADRHPSLVAAAVPAPVPGPKCPRCGREAAPEHVGPRRAAGTGAADPRPYGHEAWRAGDPWREGHGRLVRDCRCWWCEHAWVEGA